MLFVGLAAAMALSPSGSTAPNPPDPTVTLSWSAPGSCPSADQVQTWIEELTPTAGPRGSAAHATVTVQATARGFSSNIAVVAGERRDTRSLSDEDCRLLARATAVVIAVSLDPIAVARSPALIAATEPTPAPTIEPAHAIDPVPRTPVAIEPNPHRSPPPPASIPTGSGSSPHGPVFQSLEAGARVGATVGGGILPSAGVGLSLAPFIGVARLHVRATAQYWIRRRAEFEPLRDATADLRLVTGGVRICPMLSRGRVRIPLCAGIDGGLVLGQGTGQAISNARSARAPWAGVVLQPGVELSATPWLSLWFAVEGVVSLYRPVFAVDGATQEWTAGPGGLRGLAGLQLHRRRKKP